MRPEFILRGLLVGFTLLGSLYFSIWFLEMVVGGPVDFAVFWKAAVAPLSEVYAPAESPFIYPPPALFLFKPLALLPMMPSYFAWTAISALVFGIAAMRLAGIRATAASFIPMAATKGIVLGQCAMFLGGALLAAVQTAPVIMGALFGIVGVIKPQIVLFAPLAFAARREWKQLISMVVATGAVILASLLIFGPALWVDWVEAMPAFRQIVDERVSAMVITPAGQAEAFGQSANAAMLLGAFLGGAAILRAGRAAEREVLVALIVAASLAAAPYAHVHDTIAMLPGLFVLMLRGRWAIAIPAAVIFLGVFYLIPLALSVFLTALAIRPALARTPQTESESEPLVAA